MSTFAFRTLAVAVMSGAALTLAGPAAFASTGPQACPDGSHGAVLSDPRNPSGEPLYLCVKTG